MTTKVDLDEEFLKWKIKNKEDLRNKFLVIHEFNKYVEEEWQIYQQENGLIDKSNKS